MTARLDYQAIFESTPGLFLVLLPDAPRFTIAAASNAYLEASMTRREDIVGRGVFEVFPDNPEDLSATGERNLAASLEQVLRTGKPDAMAVQKYDIRTPSGEFDVRYWSPLNAPVTGAQGEILYLVHRVEDVTEFIRLNEQKAALRTRAGEMELEIFQRAQEIQEANRQLRAANERLGRLDELKTQFFANVSHELRTPLTLILGPAERLLEQPSLPQEARQGMTLIIRHARLLLERVNELLDIAKLEAGKMAADYSPVDFAQLVRLAASHFETVAADRGIALEIDAATPIAGDADAGKFEQIVLNLVSNAFKFTPDDGRIRCSVHAEPESSMVVLEVADSGPGIPAGDRETVFERFRQLEPGRAGTGLGLAIARDFAALHAGTITIGEAPEGGALVVVRVPRRAPEGFPVHAAAAPAAQGGVAVPAHSASEREPEERAGSEGLPLVLVVEDNRDLNLFIRDSLANEFRCVPAYDGEEALARIGEQEPDLVLSDVMMPRMTGDQLVRRIRGQESLDAIPILLLTAKADELLRVSSLAEGVQDYVMKPFSADELRARVRNLVGMKRAREILQREFRTRTADLETLSREVVERRRDLAVAVERLRGQETLQRFLAESTARLAESLDDSATLARVAALPVPMLADWCIVDVVDENGLVERTELAPAHAAGERMKALRLGTRSVTTDDAVLVRDLTGWPVHGALQDEERRLLAELGVRSVMIVPLVAHARILGKMTFCSADSGREFGEDDLSVAQDVARRSALAIDNARLFRNAQDAIRARDEFLSIASHELKTPLTPLQLQLHTLRVKVADFAKEERRAWLIERLDTIHRQSERLHHLISELLDISRIVGGRLHLRPENVDLGQLIGEIAANIREQGALDRASSELQLDVAAGITGQWDRMRVEQIINNLLSNALKYGAGKPVLLRATADRTAATIVVRDQGIGISTEDQERIFGRFERAVSARHYGGLGLGLFIVQELLAAMGGTIRVQSTPGEGAEFVVTLPLRSRQSNTSEEST